MRICSVGLLGCLSLLLAACGGGSESASGPKIQVENKDGVYFVETKSLTASFKGTEYGIPASDSLSSGTLKSGLYVYVDFEPNSVSIEPLSFQDFEFEGDLYFQKAVFNQNSAGDFKTSYTLDDLKIDVELLTATETTLKYKETYSVNYPQDGLRGEVAETHTLKYSLVAESTPEQFIANIDQYLPELPNNQIVAFDYEEFFAYQYTNTSTANEVVNISMNQPRPPGYDSYAYGSAFTKTPTGLEESALIALYFGEVSTNRVSVAPGETVVLSAGTVAEGLYSDITDDFKSHTNLYFVVTRELVVDEAAESSTDVNPDINTPEPDECFGGLKYC